MRIRLKLRKIMLFMERIEGQRKRARDKEKRERNTGKKLR
jgi:hypothetical protein